MPPSVSIALPVYNGARYIELAVRSLLVQSGDIEIVISDDASTDDTVEIIHSIDAGNIRLITNVTNGGQFVNLNRALKACLGRYM